jgi:hypothetical protein
MAVGAVEDEEIPVFVEVREQLASRFAEGRRYF